LKLRGKKPNNPKKAMEDIVPHEILYRGKEGFSIPIKKIGLKKELKPMMMETLAPEKLNARDFLMSIILKNWNENIWKVFKTIAMAYGFDDVFGYCIE